MCWNLNGRAADQVLSGDDQVRSSRADLDSYLRACEDGRLYEELMEPGDDRAKFKTRLFADVYFGDPGYPSLLRDRFQQMYPTVAGVLRDLKRRGHKHPARLMQSYESTLFIAVVCRRLTQEHPGIPIFTIHDSILTVPDGMELVRRIILEEFAKLGVCPSLKTEDYTASESF